MFGSVGQEEVITVSPTAEEAPIVGQCCEAEQVCISRTALAIGSGVTILFGLSLFFTTIQLLRR